MKVLLTREDVIASLKKLLKDTTLEEAAKDLGYKSPGSLHDVLVNRRAPNKTILSRLGLKREKVEQYRRIARKERGEWQNNSRA